MNHITATSRIWSAYIPALASQEKRRSGWRLQRSRSTAAAINPPDGRWHTALTSGPAQGRATVHINYTAICCASARCRICGIHIPLPNRRQLRRHGRCGRNAPAKPCSVIDLLPALPEAWPDGSFQGLVGEGKFCCGCAMGAGQVDACPSALPCGRLLPNPYSGAEGFRIQSTARRSPCIFRKKRLGNSPSLHCSGLTQIP